MIRSTVRRSSLLEFLTYTNLRMPKTTRYNAIYKRLKLKTQRLTFPLRILSSPEKFAQKSTKASSEIQVTEIPAGFCTVDRCRTGLKRLIGRDVRVCTVVVMSCLVNMSSDVMSYASQSGHAIYRGSRGIGLERNLCCSLVFEQNLQF